MVGEGGEVVEVEVLERLDRREMRCPDPHRRARGLTVGELALQDGGEVFLVWPVLLAGPAAEVFPDPPGRGGLCGRGLPRPARSWGSLAPGRDRRSWKRSARSSSSRWVSSCFFRCGDGGRGIEIDAEESVVVRERADRDRVTIRMPAR